MKLRKQSHLSLHQGFPGGSAVKNPPAGDARDMEEIPWRRKCQPTLVFLPGKPLGQRSLAGYSPLGCEESDTTKQLSMHIPLHQKE